MSWELKFVVGFLALPFGLFASVGLIRLAMWYDRDYEFANWVFWPVYAVVCIALGLLAIWIL